MLDLNARNGTFIIAEAGTAHADADPQMRLAKALRYVDAAARAGADAVKFQLFAEPNLAEDMFCWIDGDAERAVRWSESAMRLRAWRRVKEQCEAQGIVFLASVFQHRTVAWLNELEVEATKVASRAARDFPYGKSPAPYIVSDGMYELPERDDVIGMQCEANYPSRSWWGGTLPGFSDHSARLSRGVDALERGCKLLEVHFYVRHEEAGPDLPAALPADKLTFLCRVRGWLRGNLQ